MSTAAIKLDADEELFSSFYPKDQFPTLSLLTLGIICVQEIPLHPDYVYLFDSVEDNEFFVYDRDLVGRATKQLWKLKHFKITQNSDSVTYPVISTPKKIEITVQVKGVPCFDPDFGEKAGSWVTLDYEVRVQVRISASKIGLLKESKNPLRTVKNRMTTAARSVLPYLDYHQALTGQIRENLADWLRGYKPVNDTGLEVEMVEIEAITGSEKVSESFQNSFDRLLTAKDKTQIAGLFQTLDENTINAYLQMGENPGAGDIIAAKARIATQAMTAFVAAGYNPMEAYKLSSEGLDKNKTIRVTDAKDKPLQQMVSEMALGQIKSDDWSPLSPPINVKHAERLKWEKDVLLERIGQYVVEDPDEKLFIVKLADDSLLKVRWDDPKSIPTVWINGRPRQDEFAILAPNAWNPEKVTVWDIYQAGRRYIDA